MKRKRPSYTPRQVAEILGVSVATVGDMLENGELEASSQPCDGPHVQYDSVESRLAESGRVKRRVLVLDDEPLLIRSVTRLLERYLGNVSVEGYSNMYTGLVRAGQWKPDLVLLDVNQGGVDTLDACRVLTEQVGAAVIAFTGFIEDDDRAAFLEIGARDFWEKPLDPERVGVVLGEL